MLIDSKSLPHCIHGHTIVDHKNCFNPKDKQPKLKQWWEGKKIGTLDIETSGLEANGFTSLMLSWYVKTVGKNEYIGCCIDPKDIHNPKVKDKKVVQALVDLLMSHKYDIMITYFGTRFDVTYIRSRAMYHKIPFPVYGEILHLDLYYTVRNKMRLGSNRLESVCDFLEIPGKTKLVFSTWSKAMYGDTQALKYIYDHNKFDVKILEDVFHRLKMYIKFSRTSL